VEAYLNFFFKNKIFFLRLARHGHGPGVHRPVIMTSSAWHHQQLVMNHRIPVRNRVWRHMQPIVTLWTVAGRPPRMPHRATSARRWVCHCAPLIHSGSLKKSFT